MTEDQDKSQQTEEPTAKRLEQAREHGDVVKSSELTTFILLGGGTLAIAMFGHSTALAIARQMMMFIEQPEQMSVDGAIRPPLLTDNDRWRRVVFDFESFASFQRPDDSLTGFDSAISDKDKTLTLTKGSDKNWKANFTYTRLATDQLELKGSMDGHKVQMKLKLSDRDTFTLVNRGFHWINEYPFQR